MEIFRPALDENPAWRHKLGLALANLGALYLDLGRNQDAVDAAEESVE